MSLLHSFYCWGHMGVVLISTAFFTLFGVDNWKVMALLWALIPLGNLIACSCGCPLRTLLAEGRKGHVPPAAVQAEAAVLGAAADDGMRRGQRAGGEPMGVHLCGKGPGGFARPWAT